MVGLNDRMINEIIKEVGNEYTTKANLDPEHMDNPNAFHIYGKLIHLYLLF